MTRTEAALIALKAALAAAAAAATPALPAPTRNREIATVLADLAGGGALLNLTDGDGEVTDRLLGEEGDVYELAHRAAIEIIVENADQEERDATFDAGLEVIAAAVEADGTLGGTVSHAEIEAIARSGFVTDGAPQIKAAVVTVRLTFTSPRPF